VSCSCRCQPQLTAIKRGYAEEPLRQPKSMYDPTTSNCSGTGGSAIQFFRFSWNSLNAGNPGRGLSSPVSGGQ
jgi:hypothetical protein